MKKNMDAIGLKIVFRKDALQELRKMARQGKLPMRADGWNEDYPDAENFMQLLYGPNVGQENHARFSLPEFDSSTMPRTGYLIRLSAPGSSTR